MNAFQLNLNAAELLATNLSVVSDSLRLARGASEFRNLGPAAQVQSMSRSIEYLYREVYRFMAKQGKELKNETPRGNIAWCNYKLSDEDKAQFSSWQPEADEVGAGIVQMVCDGYRFNLSYDQYNKSMQVTCIAPLSGTENTGKGFSTFASSWDRVWALVVFKHYTVFQQKWPDAQPPRSGDAFG